MKYILTEKEKSILMLRKFKLTLVQIGQFYFVTPERIRQIEAKANEKIRCNNEHYDNN